MTQQHTPGPWTTDTRFRDDDGEIGVYARDPLAGLGQETTAVCRVSRSRLRGDHTDERSAANARLIASAPALLAALCALVRAVSDGESCPCCGLSMAAHHAGADSADIDECPIMLARSAIAAARGKGGAA